eukprot:GHVR01008249.1.p1 GENE.GHVR01008249.1~~GHVR01008249.1.p1  ORF type:complete len:335 (+),score=124.42 GHVR01008249.1:144-1007(+)
MLSTNNISAFDEVSDILNNINIQLKPLFYSICYERLPQLILQWNKYLKFINKFNYIYPTPSIQRLLFIFASRRFSDCNCILHDGNINNYIGKGNRINIFEYNMRSNIKPYLCTNSKIFPDEILKYVYENIIFPKSIININTIRACYVAAAAAGNIQNLNFIYNRFAVLFNSNDKKTEIDALSYAINSGNMSAAWYVFYKVKLLSARTKSDYLTLMWKREQENIIKKKKMSFNVYGLNRHTHIYTHTYIHTDKHTPTHTHIPTYTHTPPHTHTPTHSHTITHTPSNCD